MAIKGVVSLGKTRGGASGATALDVMQIKDAYATAIGHGDPVALGSSGNAGYLILGADALVPIGILRGIEYFDADGTWRMRKDYPASTTNSGVIDGIYSDVKAYIETVENRVFQMVANGTPTQAMVGTTKALSAVGTVVNGMSQATVDIATSVTSQVQLVRILGLSEIQGNVFGAGAVLDVEFVNSQGDAT